MSKVHTCTACGKRLTAVGHEIWLELDQRINEYHDDGVPEDQSQGWFPFGVDCANAARRAAAAALIAHATA